MGGHANIKQKIQAMGESEPIEQEDEEEALIFFGSEFKEDEEEGETIDDEVPITVKCLTSKYFDEIMELIEEYYMPQFSLWKLLVLTEEGLISIKNKIHRWLQECASLVALNDKTEEIIGFVIGSVWVLEDRQRAQMCDGLFQPQEIEAVYHLYTLFHQSADAYFINNTNTLYNLHIMMFAPSVTRSSLAVQQLLSSIMYFCDIFGAGGICSIAPTEQKRRCLEGSGFNVIAHIYSERCFKDYPLLCPIDSHNRRAYLMAFLIKRNEKGEASSSLLDYVQSGIDDEQPRLQTKWQIFV